MVDKFKKILSALISAKGAVSVFAVMKMDDITDKWSVIICAPWTDDNSLETFTFILDEIKKELSSEEVSSVARIAVFKKADHLIEELLKYKAGSEIENQRINGNMVHFAYVIESNDALP